MIFGYGLKKKRRPSGIRSVRTALILLPLQNRLVCFTYFNIYRTWPHDMTYISRKQLANVAIATILRFILQ